MINNQEKLLEQWGENSKKITTERIQINIKQIKDWYEGIKMDDGTWQETPSIIINPDFQRLYRWDKEQKSDLIESILLGIPVPPIFVSENLEGKYEVIDGLQRISTILEFLGVLKNDKIKPEKSISKGLVEPFYLKSLEGMLYKDMPEVLQKRFLNTYRIDLNILTSESDISAKYELFNRLNSGGTGLTKQEIRNTLLIQFNRKVYDGLKELSKDENFREIVNITDKKEEVEKDTEMVLRFFALIDNNEGDEISFVSNFLDKKMKVLIKSEGLNEDIFTNTFKILNNFEDFNVLKRFSDGKFKGPVMIPGFDLIAGGIGYNIKNGNFDVSIDHQDDLLNRIEFIWNNEEFNNHIKQGNYVEHKLKVCLDIGKKLFNMGSTLEEIKLYITKKYSK